MTSPRDATLDLIFRNARTHGAWTDRPVTETTLREVWELAKLGPTSANGMPGRIVFVVSPEAKAKLKPALIANNVAKTMSSPVTAIIAHDLEFYEKLPTLYPQTDARSWFVGNPSLIEATAFRNGSLQGAYFMIAARACGLDCGPMSGFDNAVVDEAFFSGTSIRSNFLCNLGYAESAKVRPRNPRLDFDEVCRIV